MLATALLSALLSPLPYEDKPLPLSLTFLQNVHGILNMFAVCEPSDEVTIANAPDVNAS